MVDIYGLDSVYKRYKDNIEEWDTNSTNKDLVKRFLRQEIERLSPGKKTTTIQALKYLFNGTKNRQKPIKKAFNALTIEDMKEIDAHIWNEKLKPETHRFYNSLIKRMFYFEYLDSKDEEKQRIINRLQTRIRAQQLIRNQSYIREVTEDEIVSVDEVLKMMNRSTRPIEKGLMAVAFEGGKRPNEYLSCKVKDVKKTSEGFEITITPSKAGHKENDRATLYIYNFKTYFAEFWNAHPFKDKPESPLFFREDDGHLGEPLGSQGARKIISKLATQTGLKKKISPYSFRRGGYTWKLKSGMNDETASKDMGWRNGSKQKASYLHITKEDVVNERKRLAGIFVENKKMQNIKDKPCPWCYVVNAPGNDVCENCGKELDLRKILEKEREQRETMKTQMLSLLADKMDAMMKDPRTMKAWQLKTKQVK